MFTFPANFITEMLKNAGVEWRTLLEIEAASTLYYSDQKLTVDAQVYSAMVKGFGKVRNGRAGVELYNIPRIDDQIKPGQTITFYFWMVGLASGDKAKIFKGVINEDIKGGAPTLSFTCSGMGEWFDKEILQPLSPASYPNADPSYYGRFIPEILGVVKNIECLPIEAGMATTLRADITSSQTTIEITDYAHESLAFPSSGTVFIGDEKITYTSITQSDTPTLNGCTRGVSGTTATSHSYGDAVLEDVASVKYKMCQSDTTNPIQAMTKPRIIPLGRTVKEAVQIDASDYSTNLNTGEFTLTNLPAIRRKIAIAVTQQPTHTNPVQPDQPITTQPIVDVTPGTHDHIESQQTISLFMDTNSNFGFSSVLNNERIVNGKFTESGSWDPNLSNWEIKVQMSAYAGYSGDLVEGRIKARLWRSVSADFTAQTKWYVNGGLKESIDCVLNDAPVTYTGAWKTLTSNDWADFLNSNSYLTVSSSSGIPSGIIYGNEVWLEIRFTPPSPSKILTSPRTTDTVSNRTTDMDYTQQDALVGGDSVTDAFGGPLIANAEGRKDTSGGHYTGTPNALIEKPWEQIHFMLEQFGNGITHSDIDISGSFADCDTNLPSNWKWGFAITKNLHLNILLKRLELQTWCRFKWGLDGLARLERIKTSGTSIRTLNTNSDCFLSGKLGDTNRELLIKFRRPKLNQLANKVAVQYLLDPTLGHWSNPDAYDEIIEDSDSDSITEYGERKKTWRMWAVRDDTMAQTLRGYLLDYYKDPRQAVSYLTDWTQLQLQSNDLVDIISQPSGISGKHRIFDVAYDMPIPLRDKGLKVQLTLVDLLSGTLLLPDPISCIAAGVDPTTDVTFLVVPIPAGCIATGVDPGVILGSTIAIPSPAGCITTDTRYFDSSIYFDSTRYFGVLPIVILGSTTALPAPANCITSTLIGLVHTGHLVIPAPVGCITAGVDPGVILGSIITTPAPASCITNRVNPTIVIGAEDLTTYTEVDPNSRITVTSARSTFTGLTRNEDAYVYKDFGAFYFGDFEIYADVRLNSGSENDSLVGIIGLSNTVNDWDDWGAGLSVHFMKAGGNNYLVLFEIGGSNDFYVISGDTTYYVTFERVGTACTLKVYSDSARTNLLDTLSITVNTTTWRYLYVTISGNTGDSYACSGYSENIKIL
jgi:hypothetical protein